MRIALLALLSLCVSASAEDFRWQVTDAPSFTWSITAREGGGLQSTGGTEVTSSSAGQVSETPALESFVHRINVSNVSTGGQGSATHIGGGVFLTCRHVFARQWNAVKVGGMSVKADPSIASGPDFAVVRTDVSSHASAPVSTAQLSDGETLHVYGAKTGLHTGVLSHRRWSQGYRAVVCQIPTESGDSGAGVFNAAGELVGVHWGSTGNEVFFTPLSEVASMLTPGSVVETLPSSTATEPSTAICPCQGFRGRAHCFCLQRGVACKCNRTTGSEWLMADGRPVRKTGQYANPNKPSPLTTPPFSISVGEPDSNGQGAGNASRHKQVPSGGGSSSAPLESDGSIPTKRNDGRWWWTAPDGVQWWASSQPKHGDSVVGGGVTWDCVDGRMVQRGSQMAAEIQPKGHFEMRRQCVNGVCRMYRVWVPE